MTAGSTDEIFLIRHPLLSADVLVGDSVVGTEVHLTSATLPLPSPSVPSIHWRVEAWQLRHARPRASGNRVSRGGQIGPQFSPAPAAGAVAASPSSSHLLEPGGRLRPPARPTRATAAAAKDAAEP